MFVSEVDRGVTALVLLGRGTMSFHPEPATEKGQVKIFAGSETLDTAFDAAFVRINPSDFEQLAASPQLRRRPRRRSARLEARAREFSTTSRRSRS